MTNADAWPGIEKNGLLSAESLVDLFGVDAARKTELLTRRRAESIPITHVEHGRAVLRDQIPLSEKRLASCLQDGISVEEWLRILNSKVFFWVSPDRLKTLRDADAYRGERQLVLEVDCRSLVTQYEGLIWVADRNTGATRPMAHPRGRTTFLPLSENGRRRIVELVIEGGVPDVVRHVIRATQVGGGIDDEIVYPR